jgi:hypothetical protein
MRAPASFIWWTRIRLGTNILDRYSDFPHRFSFGGGILHMCAARTSSSHLDEGFDVTPTVVRYRSRSGPACRAYTGDWRLIITHLIITPPYKRTLPAVHNFERDLMFLLHDVARLIRLDADKRARAHGMTRAQWGILIWLERQPGLSQKELAEILSRDEETIYRWARDRKVPHLRLPDKGYRFPLEEIMDTLRVDPHEEDAA